MRKRSPKPSIGTLKKNSEDGLEAGRFKVDVGSARLYRSQQIIELSSAQLEPCRYGGQAHAVIERLIAHQDPQSSRTRTRIGGQLQMQGEVGGPFKKSCRLLKDRIGENLRFSLFDADQIGGGRHRSKQSPQRQVRPAALPAHTGAIPNQSTSPSTIRRRISPSLF
jgi:hypothetical protein